MAYKPIIFSKKKHGVGSAVKFWDEGKLWKGKIISTEEATAWSPYVTVERSDGKRGLVSYNELLTTRGRSKLNKVM